MPTNKTYDNLEKMIFSGVGEYGIPEIMPEEYEPCEWIGFNYAASISGQTYNIRSMLKEKGFRWDGKTKSWVKKD